MRIGMPGAQVPACGRGHDGPYWQVVDDVVAFESDEFDSTEVPESKCCGASFDCDKQCEG